MSRRLERHLNRLGLAPKFVLGITLIAVGEARSDGDGVAFEKRVLSEQYLCDGINAGDLDNDGDLDIIAGPYWYEGPGFVKRHEFYQAVPLEPAKSPSNSMFSYVYDFDGDGWQDILVLGRVHMHPAYWYENPPRKGRSLGQTLRVRADPRRDAAVCRPRSRRTAGARVPLARPVGPC